MSGPARAGKQNRLTRVAERGWRQQIADLVGLVVGLVLFSQLHSLTGGNA